MIFESAGFVSLEAMPDLSGNDRVLVFGQPEQVQGTG
jgi:hypothetical protein